MRKKITLIKIYFFLQINHLNIQNLVKLIIVNGILPHISIQQLLKHSNLKKAIDTNNQ